MYVLHYALRFDVDTLYESCLGLTITAYGWDVTPTTGTSLILV
jgi:hypothetical protein